MSTTLRFCKHNDAHYNDGRTQCIDMTETTTAGVKILHHPIHQTGDYANEIRFTCVEFSILDCGDIPREQGFT